MTPNETANWIAFAGLLVLVFVQAAIFWTRLGRVLQRSDDFRKELDAIKAEDGADGKANSVFREAFARFEGRIEAKLESMDGRVADLAMSISQLPSPPYTPRGRPREPAG